MQNEMMKILIIDDNQDNLMILKALILEKFPNASVLSALNGQIGLELAAREEPDIVLLDINMSGIDGCELCRRLKADEKLCDTPVVLITTGRNDKESRLKALECSAEAFLSKPIDEIELTTQIRAMFITRNAISAKNNETERLALLVEEKTTELRSENVKRTQSEEALLEAQRLAHIGSFEFDMKTNLLSCTDEGLRICNLSQDDLNIAQDTILQCVHPDDRVTMVEMNQKAISEGQTVEFFCRMSRQDGEVRHVFMRVRPVFDDNGICIKTSGIIQDVTESKLREEQLNQSMKDLLESQRIAHLGTWSLDLHTNRVIMSEELYKVYELDPAFPPPTYTEHKKLFTPESWTELTTAIERTRVLGIPYELELETVKLDGSNGWLWVRGEANTDASGKIVSLWGAAQDITKRKQAEARVKESEAKYRYLFENSAVGNSFTLPTGEVDFNTAMCRMLGYTAEELKGKKWWEVTHPDDIRLSELEVSELISGKRKELRFNKRYIKKDGSTVWADVISTVRWNDDGSLIYFMTSIIDITDRIKAQESLKQSEERFQLLFEKAPLGYQSLDTDGRFLEVNQQWLETFGYSKEEVIGKRFGDFLCAGQVDSFQHCFLTFKSQGHIRSEFEMLSKNGEHLFVLFEGKIAYDSNGDFLQTHCILQNITDQRATESALRESEERYRYLFEYSGVGVGYYTIDGVVISYNTRALENIGGKLEDHVGKSFFELFQPDQAEIYYSRVKHAISSVDPQVYEDYLVINSQAKWFSSAFTRVTNADGKIIGVMIASLDITAQKQAEEAAIKSDFKFRSLFDEMPSGVAVYKVMNKGTSGTDYIIQDYNKVALKAEGKESAEVLGRSFFDLRPNIDRCGLIPVFQRVWQTGESAYVTSAISTDKKFSNWYENRVYKLPSGEIVAIFDDVTEVKRAEEDIQHLAYHDYLTDTFNRRHFENEFAAKSTGAHYPLAIVTGDLNGLKLVNDSFGHYSGDLAIQQFAIEIQKRIPENAILARVGGDEFSILLTHSSEANAENLAGALQSDIRIIIKDNNGNDVAAALTATFGYSCQSFPGQDIDELVKEVEKFINRRKFLENTSKRSNVIDAIMSTLFEKSEREQKHSVRVSNIATAIAKTMRLDDATVAKVRVAGALHDIGKIGIDESILNKTNQLSDLERELIKQHPIRSARILASVDEYLDIVPIVMAHHERVDGCGYPARLTGKQIPIEAKIIAVADSFDAMTVNRPYRDAISKELAAEELKRCAGSQFDQQVVDAFLRTVLPETDSFVTKAKENIDASDALSGRVC